MNAKRLFCAVVGVFSSLALAQEEQITSTPAEPLAVASVPAPANAPASEDILPAAGDWAVAIDANPFLEYAGQLLSDTGATAPAWNFLTANQAITGKYFLKSNLAARASLRIGTASTSQSVKTANRTLVNAPTFPATVTELENSVSVTASTVGASGGLEWRRGQGRLQGFYGAEVGINVTSTGQSYVYGNGLTQAATADVANVNVDAQDNLGLNNLVADPYGNPARVLRRSGGTNFGVGVRGFIGAEYFILPKLSLGGEFGWGVAFVAGGTASEELESEGTVNGSEVKGLFKREAKNDSRFVIDSENLGTVFGPAGRLRLTLHF